MNNFLIKIAKAKKLDISIGPKLPKLFKTAKFKNVKTEIAQPVLTTPEHRSYLYMRLHAIEPLILKNHLLTKTQLKNAYKGLEDLANDEETLLVGASMFQVCGQKEK